MVGESKREAVATAMRQVNQAWLDGRSEDLASMVHQEMEDVTDANRPFL